MARTLLRGWVRRLSGGPSSRVLQGFRPALETLETRLTPSVTFAAQQTFATGANPQSVAVGDFNGDGRPDLVVANANDNTLSVLLNATPGGVATPSFTAQQTFAVSAGATFVAVGDFNGDGRPDIAVGDNGGFVSVLLNTTPAGSNTVSFAAAQTFAVGSGATGVAVGDFNGDGRPNLAVTNEFSNTVSVLLNTTPAGAATPSFAAQQTFAVGTNPFAVVAVDLNGDGRPDLAVANNGGGVSVLLNTTAAGAGSASFTAQTTFAVGTSPRGLVAGDFNGDGRPNLAVTNQDSNTVSVLLNTTAAGATTPSFAAQQTFAVGTGPYGVAVGDFDGDGLPDLAVANGNDKTVSVLLDTTAVGATTVSFAAQQTFAVGTGPLGVAAGDFNGDGRPDLAVTNSVNNAVSVLPNTTTPFSSTVPVVVAQFGTSGVYEFNRASRVWQQLTGANASLLAADAQGDVIGEFKGNGVWEYKPSVGFKQLNGVDATALAIDPNGDVTAEFPGYGVGEYIPAAGWHILTLANATLLAMDAYGDVVAEFPGNGVWEYKPAAGFKQINGVDATALAIDPNGDVVANFAGYGVGEFLPSTGWQIINGNQAKALTIDGHFGVAAVFQGYGTAVYSPTAGWRTLAPINAVVLAVDALGDVYGDFTGSGVWEYDVYRGWVQLTSAEVSLLAGG